jgi:hypothetical protein
MLTRGIEQSDDPFRHLVNQPEGGRGRIAQRGVVLFPLVSDGHSLLIIARRQVGPGNDPVW